MYCLTCSTEVAYQSPDCPRCGVDLRYASHGYGDHISQVLRAVEAVCVDELSWGDGEAVFRQFLTLAHDFLRYWRLDTHPGLSRRVSGLSAEAVEGLVQLEESLPALNLAFELYERGFSQNCRKTLIEANEELEAFFRLSCAGIVSLRRAFPAR